MCNEWSHSAYPQSCRSSSATWVHRFVWCGHRPPAVLQFIPFALDTKVRREMQKYRYHKYHTYLGNIHPTYLLRMSDGDSLYLTLAEACSWLVSLNFCRSLGTLLVVKQGRTMVGHLRGQRGGWIAFADRRLSYVSYVFRKVMNSYVLSWHPAIHLHPRLVRSAVSLYILRVHLPPYIT